jgi:hypothetical protein
MRIADPPPAVCSACHNSQPELRHVDFDAEYDGPVIGGGPEARGIAVDDLILCERCIRDAGRLVGLEPIGDTAATIEALQSQLLAAGDWNSQLGKYVWSLQEALASRPDSLPSRPRGRLPKPENIEA